MPQRNLVAILLVALLAMACYRATEHNPSVRMFQRALGEITQNYVEEKDEDKLIEAAIRGMVGQLDENSGFQSPERSQEMQIDLHQQFGGIGIEVNLDPQSQQLIVVNPVVGTPAFDAGLLSGDRILEIDGKDTKGFKKIEDAVKLIRGSPGVTVALKIERSGTDKPLSFNIPRAIIRTDSVLGDTRLNARQWNFTLADHPDIAYIRVLTFGERTVEELKVVLQGLEKQGFKGLILDLRGNRGGLLDAAVEMCNLFVRDGTIVSLHGRDGKSPRVYTADGKAKYGNFPMVVLVNRESASASEIVASCLQDHGRAAIAGERSYGKGTVQNVIPLEGDHSLRLTTAHYFRPSGKNIHRKDAKDDEWGVQPDKGMEVKLTEEEMFKLMLARRNRDLQRPGAPTPPVDEDTPDEKPAADEALQKAVDYLHNALDAKKPAATAKNAA